MTTMTNYTSDQIVPVVRSKGASASNFVENYPPQEVKVGDTNILTGALVVGKNISLLGISQHDDLIANGSQCVTDSIVNTVALDSLVFRIVYNREEPVFVKHRFLAKPVFIERLAGLWLEYSESDLTIDLTGMKGHNFSLHFKVSFEVRASLHLGTSVIYLDASIVKHDASSDIQVEIVGYTLDAKRINRNRRPNTEVKTKDRKETELAHLVLAKHIHEEGSKPIKLFSNHEEAVQLVDFLKTKACGSKSDQPRDLGTEASNVAQAYWFKANPYHQFYDHDEYFVMSLPVS